MESIKDIYEDSGSPSKNKQSRSDENCDSDRNQHMGVLPLTKGTKNVGSGKQK